VCDTPYTKIVDIDSPFHPPHPSPAPIGTENHGSKMRVGSKGAKRKVLATSHPALVFPPSLKGCLHFCV